MGTALAGLGAAPPKAAGAARDAAPAGTRSTPFADVMEAQDKPAAPQDSSRASRRAADAGDRDARAGDDATQVDPAAAATDDAAGQDLDESGVDRLLGLCGAPASTGEAASATGAADGAAATLTEPAVPLPAPFAMPQPPLPQPADAGVRARGLVDSGRGMPGLPSVGGLPMDAAIVAAGAEPGGAAAAEGAAAEAGATDLATQPAATGPADARSVPRAGDATGAARPPELRAPPGTPAWADELGSRVTWMLERGEQVASLRLTPENLGPLEVRIAVREGETTVWFGAAQADTRAALEQSLPRLREMLGASGLALANAGVFSETPRDPQRGFTAAALARASQESGAEASGATVTSITGRGLVDLYA